MRRSQGAVGLDADLEALRVQRRDQRFVELQQRLPAGAHDVRLRHVVLQPVAGHHLRQGFGVRVLSAVGSVGAHEIRIAEAADGFRAVVFQSAPQIAAGKTQEHGRAAAAGALALKRVIDFFDLVSHRTLYFA